MALMTQNVLFKGVILAVSLTKKTYEGDDL